jgi:hypothetical protein
MPLNLMDAHFRSFAQQVMPKLVEQGIAMPGMKPMGVGTLLKSGTVTSVECLHYTLNPAVSVVIAGCESTERFDQAMEAAGKKPIRRMGCLRGGSTVVLSMA